MNCEYGHEKIPHDNIDLPFAAAPPLASSGDPLDNSIRAFMEARFGVDLRKVRVHTDRWAVDAAKRLNAFAFTRGTDIYFGADQYAPEKPNGRWLIAHELVHVIQQSRIRLNELGGAPPIGDPHSPFDVEASLIADEVLKSNRVSPITPDNSGTIRRLISIVPSSAQITLNVGGVRSAITVTDGGRRLICNLTQGFNIADPKQGSHAFDATGQLDIIVDNDTELAAILGGTLRVGFVQIARMHFKGIFWAGRKRSEGSVGLVQSQPPAWPENQLISLDSANGISPFIEPARPQLTDQPQMGRILVHISNIKMGDHPKFGAGVKGKNTKTGADNYLFNLKEHTEYFTVLVTIDNRGVVSPLAHFHWDNDYDAKIRWRGGNPIAVQSGKITFDPPMQVGPTDAAISAFLKDPKPPFTNDIDEAASKNAVTGGNASNFSHNPNWFVNVPPDFWM